MAQDVLSGGNEHALDGSERIMRNLSDIQPSDGIPCKVLAPDWSERIMHNLSSPSKQHDPANTDWTPVVSHNTSMDSRETLADAYARLKELNQEYAAVLVDGKPVGLCSRNTIGFLMSSKYGYAVYARKHLVDHIEKEFLIIQQGTCWEEGIARGLSRPEPAFYHDAILIEPSGQFLGLVSSFTLVRMQSWLLEKKSNHLKEAQGMYRGMVENAVEGIFQTSPDGRYINVNVALARIYGYDSPDELQTSLQDVASQLYVDPHMRSHFIARMKKDGIVTDFEAQVYRKDRNIIWISENARAVRNPAGNILYYEGTVEEITARKQAEENLRRSNVRLTEVLEQLQQSQAQVIQQERLSALGQMAAGIAHDFNNALTPILGYSELLAIQGHGMDSERAQRYLHTINTAAMDAAKVVGRLREFYRVREKRETPLPVDAQALISQVVSLTQPRWKDQALMHGITIRVNVDLHKVPFLAGCESELREMLTNLIFNAVDAMPRGGEITLSARHVENEIVLKVRDSGMGMSEETRKRCLEPFFTTKGPRGTGLGLAMVFGIVQRHQGRIHIDSVLGSGTTFTIRLPVYATGELLPKSTEAFHGNSSLHVLVVDDEPLIRDVVQAYLKSDANTVQTACNGREGLEMFHAERFDLVLTDRSMPEMNGDQMATQIKTTAPNTPIIMLTGFGELINASGERPSGVDLVISKPVKVEDLRRAIRRVTVESRAS